MREIFQGQSLTRLLQGTAFGVALTLILGFGLGGWQLHSKAQKLATDTARSAVVVALTPICVDKFQRGADAVAELVKLKAADSWKQDRFIADGGWATFSGSSTPNYAVAEACAKDLVKETAIPAEKRAGK